jgi:hypothetical protein
MPIRELVHEIAAGWREYHEKIRVDKKDSEFDLVVNQFPRVLDQYLSEYENKLVQGSTGAGNITAAPWIAIFDQRLTTTATREYYPVYLFSVDMSSVTLALAFGTTQFTAQFGAPSEAFPRMRAAAMRLQEMFNHLIPAHLSRGPIDLGAGPREKLHYAYEQSSILSYTPYPIDALPDETKLVSDLSELVHLYTEIVSDPLEATLDRLVEAVVEPASQTQVIEVQEFMSRPRVNDNGAKGSGGHARRRYSPESHKIGDAGEKVVLAYERERLRKLGRQDLIDRIRWHGPNREFPGWDITSFDDGGVELFIEVKACAGKAISTVNLTVNEWQAACDPGLRDRYAIYLVTNVLSAKPRVEIMRNPAAIIENSRLSCTPIVYELDLRSDPRADG